MVTKDDMIKLKENKEIHFIYELPCSLFESGYEYITIGKIETKTEDNLRQFSYED